jgi:HEAT repeat protein
LNAALALRSLDPPAERSNSMLVKALDDKNEGTTVVWALASQTKGADPLLRRAFQSKNSEVRSAVAGALARRGAAAAWAVPELARAVADEDSSVRDSAIGALAAIGPAAALSGPAIARAAETDDHAYVRVTAAHALWRLGVSTDVALRALARTIEEGDDWRGELREQAASYLGNFGAAAVPVLEKALRDPEPSVRVAAREALRRIQGSGGSPGDR